MRRDRAGGLFPCMSHGGPTIPPLNPRPHNLSQSLSPGECPQTLCCCPFTHLLVPSGDRKPQVLSLALKDLHDVSCPSRVSKFPSKLLTILLCKQPGPFPMIPPNRLCWKTTLIPCSLCSAGFILSPALGRVFPVAQPGADLSWSQTQKRA